MCLFASLINEICSIGLEKQVLLDEDCFLRRSTLLYHRISQREQGGCPPQSGQSQSSLYMMPYNRFPHTVCRNKCKFNALCGCEVFRFLSRSRSRSSLTGFLPSNHRRRNWGKSSKKKAKPIGMEDLNAPKTTTTRLVITGYQITKDAKCIGDSHWKKKRISVAIDIMSYAPTALQT